MRLSLRLLLGYFLIVGIAAWFVLAVFREEVKPGVRQAMEDALVDTANLLAQLAREDVIAGHIQDGAFAHQTRQYHMQPLQAHFWEQIKKEPGFRVYITDAKGIVRFDSNGLAVGQDYSRWNDVYRTLRGQYGARTSPDTPNYPDATVMHVAAPIRDDRGQIIGSLTVAKPNRLVQPYIDRSESRISHAGWLLLGIALVIGLIVTLSLHHNLSRLEQYAAAIGKGERAELPRLSIKELRLLGATLETMRTRLEGRQYVEQYVSTLTHEMKSPLTAIRGAAELLDDAAMPEHERLRFLGNIKTQVARLQNLIERMLGLASVEYRRRLESTAPLDLRHLVQEALAGLQPQIMARQLNISTIAGAPVMVQGEAFLLTQAIANLLDNAISFSPIGASIDLHFRAGPPTLIVHDQGPGIPDYAQEHLFERFYSLPRPDGQGKSTGLGLAFVQEVAELHGGSITLSNHPEGGAIAELQLPNEAESKTR